MSFLFQKIQRLIKYLIEGLLFEGSICQFESKKIFDSSFDANSYFRFI